LAVAQKILQTSGTLNDLYSAAYGNSRYVAVGANGTLLTTTDAVTWETVATNTTRDLRGVTIGALNPNTLDATPLFVAVGAAGTVLTSSDGLAWKLQSPISTDDFASVTFGSQFVAVGKAGKIYTSVDGVTWQAQSSRTTNDLTAVSTFAPGYSAVGESGTNIFSY
jgi:hypothetical protein